MEHINLLVSADSFNNLCQNINTVKRNTEAQLEVSRVVDLEINTEKTKCMVMLYHQNAGQSHNSLIANKSFENVGEVPAFGNNRNKSKLH
jgi:hypothetical protein